MIVLWKVCAGLAWSRPVHCTGSIGRYDGTAATSDLTTATSARAHDFPTLPARTRDVIE
jgi:hypothetical protein